MSTGPIINSDSRKKGSFLSQSGSLLPIDSQKRSLLQYIENGRATLREIREDFYLSQSKPDDTTCMQRAARRLALFSADTDEWGFDLIYKVAFGLQVLLVHSFNKTHDDCFWEILNQGLELLSSLLNQCEYDYRQRITVTDVLESFERAACH